MFCLLYVGSYKNDRFPILSGAPAFCFSEPLLESMAISKSLSLSVSSCASIRVPLCSSFSFPSDSVNTDTGLAAFISSLWTLCWMREMLLVAVTLNGLRPCKTLSLNVKFSSLVAWTVRTSEGALALLHSTQIGHMRGSSVVLHAGGGWTSFSGWHWVTAAVPLWRQSSQASDCILWLMGCCLIPNCFAEGHQSRIKELWNFLREPLFFPLITSADLLCSSTCFLARLRSSSYTWNTSSSSEPGWKESCKCRK